MFLTKEFQKASLIHADNFQKKEKIEKKLTNLKYHYKSACSYFSKKKTILDKDIINLTKNIQLEENNRTKLRDRQIYLNYVINLTKID